MDITGIKLTFYLFSLGHFRTPLADYLPHLLPPESETAYFQAILPLEQANQGQLKPICSKLLEYNNVYRNSL